jgi:SAM-dependent methyltransferase
LPSIKIASTVAAQLDFDPADYGERIRSEIPRYDELQVAAIDAIPFTPERVLELGFGTAETTQRLLDRYPETRITGLDSSPEMVFKARELGWEEMRLGRIEDPLPDGPWDLVISVLTVNRLDDAGKRDLCRRVREQSRSLVIGDRFDDADGPTRLAEWCGGEVCWSADGLAVVRASV